MKFGAQVGLRPGHFVLDGDPAPPPPKGHSHPQFSAHICCGQMAGWINMPLGMKVGLDPSNIALDGDPAPLPKKEQSPQFLAHVYCGQTAGWMKMPIGKEHQHSGHIALDGDPAPPCERGTAVPRSLFGPCLLWPRSPISATAELLYIRAPRNHVLSLRLYTINIWLSKTLHSYKVLVTASLDTGQQPWISPSPILRYMTSDTCRTIC